MKSTRITLLALFTLLAIACQQDQSKTQVEPAKSTELSEVQIGQPISQKQEKKKEKGMTITLKGTIQYVGLEGGFYGIVTNKGEKILPMGLEKQLMQDGAVIEFSGHYKDVMTIQQWGKPFVVSQAKLLKPGKSKPKNLEM